MSIQPRIKVANGFWQRFKGLMFSRPIADDEAFLIRGCSSVHTFFMRYELDLAYLDEAGRIVQLKKNMPPWRMSWGGTGVHHTLEMLAGGIDHLGLCVGEIVVLHENE